MIKSMTGFGRAEKQLDQGKVTVEIKSVNHRYLDIGVKSPRRFMAAEADIRNAVKEYAARGKVDVFVGFEPSADAEVGLQYNAALARQYITYAEIMKEDFAVADDLTVTALMGFPDVLTMNENEADRERILGALVETVREAAADHAASREAEGKSLAEDLKGKLAELAALVDQVIERAPAILEEYKEKLREKTAELLANAQIEESRLASEIVLFADKICTDEETVRLKSHIESMNELLSKDEEVGRKLDFLAQELNREANTILSKANDLLTSDLGIELKTGIEKIREQIQNIE